MKKTLLFMITLLVVLSTSLIQVSAESYNNADYDVNTFYTYDANGEPIVSAPAYTFAREVTYRDLGLSPSSQFSSTYFRNGKIFILDKGLGCIYVIDANDYTLISTYQYFDNNGKQDTLLKPNSIFVNENMDIYVADSGNSRVIVLNKDGSLKLEITKPNHIALEGLTFVPVEITASSTGKIYVIGENIYFGILELNSLGEFTRFVGVNKVQLSIFELLWRSLLSPEQRDYYSLALPQDFRSLDIDEQDFIYATAYTATDPIKRINTKGEDVLVRNGLFGNVGDIDSNLTRSDLDAIAVLDHGIYAVLDKNKGRIFVYNCDGELLYIYGGLERQDGYFMQPVDIKWMDNDNLIVTDIQRSSISIFAPTEYGRAINQASRYHYDGLYEDANYYWNEALKYNSNCDLAYVGIGKTYYFSDKYEEAMMYFKLGNNKSYYSEAFSKNRTEFMLENFVWFAAGFFLIAGAMFTVYFISRKKRKAVVKDE